MRFLRHLVALHLPALALIVAFPVLALAQEGGGQPASPPPAVRPAMGLQLPGGFTEELVVEGLVAPTAFTFLPDGRILFAEQAGVVRLWKDGALRAEPVLDIRERVNAYVERGLVGLAVDADFANNGFVYLLYTNENDASDYEGTKTNRLSRFTISGDTASVESEAVLLGTTVGRTCNDFPPGTDCLPGDNWSHVGGGLESAADGTLFVSLGEGALATSFVDGLRAQDLDLLAGKILRITRDGQGVEGNPFWNGDPNANRSKVWAYGARNPFRLTLHVPSGLPVIADVGDHGREELNVVSAGANLGWPCYEGEQRARRNRLEPACADLYALGPAAVSFPLVSLHHDVARTLIGGAFYGGTVYPEQYRGAYFFGDYERGFLATLRLDESGQLMDGPHEFVRDGADGLVALRMGPDGLLYLLSVGSGILVRIGYDGLSDPGAPHQAAETLRASYHDTAALEGVAVTTLVEALGERELLLPDGTPEDGTGFAARWDATQPAPWAHSDPYSVRWNAVTRLAAGEYLFEVRADDGIRVWLDDELLVDSWSEQPTATHRLLRSMGDGEHTIRVEYFNLHPDGEVDVRWVPLPPTEVPQPG